MEQSLIKYVFIAVFASLALASVVTYGIKHDAVVAYFAE